ncbi:MAG TPA: type II toxin-antitoxin system VapC family toxin [Spirochaetota bacterium]|nr:type II toxin-antitoxin system VapC family toxin [Spirochaetota bacterium]
MKYLLDTNICIHYLNGTSLSVRERLQTLSPRDIALCAVVKSELLAGAYKSAVYDKVRSRLDVFFHAFESLPFDDIAADIYGKVRSDLEQVGMVIGPYDMQIASIAIAHNLTLVTHNTREFSRIQNLRYENWVK